MIDKKNIRINYLYFALYFILTSFTYIYYGISLNHNSNSLESFHLATILLQSLIESITLSTLFYHITKSNKLWLLLLASTLIVVLCFIRLIDFIMLRIMDISGWKFIAFLLKETFSNFIELICVSGIKYTAIASLISLTVIIWTNVIFFRFTQKISNKIPYLFSPRGLAYFIFGNLIFLGTLGIFRSEIKNSDTPDYYAKALPWKFSFLSPTSKTIEVSGLLKSPVINTFENIDPSLFSLEHNPDIFLFVVESLRKDFLTNELTPNLSQFCNENYSIKNVLSNSNCTHKSWFSIFYSMYPFYWTKFAPKQWKQGSVPLSLLKKMGYEIHVYTSTSLEFYGMDQTIFGEKKFLANHINDFSSTPSASPAKKDQLAITKLCIDLQKSSQKNGRLFILFLDGTHYPYSSLKNRNNDLSIDCNNVNISDIQHVPLLKHVLGNKKSLKTLIHHYKNSLCAIDDLFQTFQNTLKQTDLWENSVVIFTGDHGEEFNESGCIFHTSHLSLPQLNIPLYFKLGKISPIDLSNHAKKASHIDIFPTILHYVTGKNEWGDFLQGESLLSPPQKDYTVGARSNASLPPYEFYIRRGSYRATLQFSQQDDIFHSRLLKIKSIVDEKESPISFSLEFFQKHFGDALEDLFPSQSP